jgi:hypothetical protein
MKKSLLLFAAMLCAQIATAVESKFIDDAPKGFIHIAGEAYGAEAHDFLRANTVVRVEQFSEENDGKKKHYIRLHTTATVGRFGGNPGEGNIRQLFFLLEYTTKEEAEKVRNRILELLSDEK